MAKNGQKSTEGLKYTQNQSKPIKTMGYIPCKMAINGQKLRKLKDNSYLKKV
jgi:hypothetical protein